MNVMSRYEWPGNVRELQNIVERILVMNMSVEEIRAEHLNGIVMPFQASEEAAASTPAATLNEFEGLTLEEATRPRGAPPYYARARRCQLRPIPRCRSVGYDPPHSQIQDGL